MNDHRPNIVNVKNQWLYQQVEVEFPTKESLTGRDIYAQSASNRTYAVLDEELLVTSNHSVFNSEDVFLADFHRLTVMFALLQAKRWQTEHDQQMIVEFLTQIIYSEPCQLYLGFDKGEPVACAMVTRVDKELLISDLYIINEDESKRAAFIQRILDKVGVCTNPLVTGEIYLEL